MKKRIRKTGEIVDVINYYNLMSSERNINDSVSYIDSKGEEHYHENGLNLWWDFEDIEKTLSTDIDWEQRKYEISKSVLPCFRDGSNVWLSAEEAAKCAVYYADALIAELKKGGEK